MIDHLLVYFLLKQIQKFFFPPSKTHSYRSFVCSWHLPLDMLWMWDALWVVWPLDYLNISKVLQASTFRWLLLRRNGASKNRWNVSRAPVVENVEDAWVFHIRYVVPISSALSWGVWKLQGAACRMRMSEVANMMHTDHLLGSINVLNNTHICVLYVI